MRHLLGVHLSATLLMVLASACFAGMAALVKALGSHFPFFEAVLFRGVFGLPLVLWLLHRTGARIGSPRVALLGLRGLLGWGGMSSYYFGLQRGTLAELTMIIRTQPLWIALLAPLLIGEKAPGSTLAVLLVSLGGVALVIKPTPATLELASTAGLATALLSALAHITVRRLNATEPPQRIVVYMTIVTTCCSAAACVITGFVIPSPPQLLVLAAIALFATAGQLLMTMAYSRDRAPVVSVAGHAGVVFALLLGLLFWDEMPDGWSLLGGGVVISGGIFLAYSRRGMEEAAAATIER